MQVTGPSSLLTRRVMGGWLPALAVIAAPRSGADSKSFLAHSQELLAGHERLIALQDHVVSPERSPELGADVAQVTGLLSQRRPVAGGGNLSN